MCINLVICFSCCSMKATVWAPTLALSTTAYQKRIFCQSWTLLLYACTVSPLSLCTWAWAQAWCFCHNSCCGRPVPLWDQVNVSVHVLQRSLEVGVKRSSNRPKLSTTELEQLLLKYCFVGIWLNWQRHTGAHTLDFDKDTCIVSYSVWALHQLHCIVDVVVHPFVCQKDAFQMATSWKPAKAELLDDLWMVGLTAIPAYWPASTTQRPSQLALHSNTGNVH